MCLLIREFLKLTKFHQFYANKNQVKAESADKPVRIIIISIFFFRVQR